MNAEELAGVEPLFEHLHPLADHKRVVLDVQLGVGAAGRDEVDPLDRHDAHLPARVHPDPLQVLRLGAVRRQGAGLLPKERLEPARQIVHCLGGKPLAGPGQCLFEPLVVVGLQEIIDGGHVERLNGVLVVSGRKDDRRHVLRPHLAHHVDPREAGHLDIEEDEVRVQAVDDFDRFAAVRGLADDLGARLAGEQILQPLPGRLFVVDDKNAQVLIGRHGWVSRVDDWARRSVLPSAASARVVVYRSAPVW